MSIRPARVRRGLFGGLILQVADKHFCGEEFWRDAKVEDLDVLKPIALRAPTEPHYLRPPAPPPLKRSLPTADDLWAAQLALYPNSVRLSTSDLFRWADDPDLTADRKLMRYRSLSLALQYPNQVWYRTKPNGGFMGCRYGLKDHEYLSNFNDL